MTWLVVGAVMMAGTNAPHLICPAELRGIGCEGCDHTTPITRAIERRGVQLGGGVGGDA